MAGFFHHKVYLHLIVLLIFSTIYNSEATKGSGCFSNLPNFPRGILTFRKTFTNWGNNIIRPNMWTAFPRNEYEVVVIVNWAKENEYKVRASGFMHTFSPLVITNPSNSSESECSKILLVDGRQFLKEMEIISEAPRAIVRAQTGVSMEEFLEFLEDKGYAINGFPAPGDLTLGGVIAVGGHGTGIPMSSSDDGLPFGTVSNLVLTLTAVVWNEDKNRYALKTFNRSDPETSAMLINLGRTFVTEVTMLIRPVYKLNCMSTVQIPMSELFSTSTANATRTFESFMETTGRVDIFYFPFNEAPWLKVWTEAPIKPEKSEEVTSPFNYPHWDNVPLFMSDIIEAVLMNFEDLTALFNIGFQKLTRAALTVLGDNIWGTPKNVLLYAKPTTVRLTANGYAIITARSHVQLVTSQIVNKFQDLVSSHRSRNEFPINGPIEIRVSGLDNVEGLGVDGALPPSLSVIRPVTGHPELDCAIWIDILTFPHTRTNNLFLKEFEEFLVKKIHNGESAIVRPEWSKAWGYTDEAPWTNMSIIKDFIPQLYSKGQGKGQENPWNWAISTLQKYDPFNVYSNEFLDILLQ